MDDTGEFERAESPIEETPPQEEVEDYEESVEKAVESISQDLVRQ